MNKRFFTIKFVCDKENEKDTLDKIKRDLPVMLTVASNNEKWGGPTYANPLSKNNLNKIGYIIRLNKESLLPKKAEIQEYDFVFERQDIKNKVEALRDRYKIKKLKNSAASDISFAFQHLDSFVKDMRKLFFEELKLKSLLWEDFFYFVLENIAKTERFGLTPSVKVLPMARIDKGKIEYRIDLAKEATKDDVNSQYSAFNSLRQEFSPIILKRIKRSMLLYKRANNPDLQGKSTFVYEDPATGEEISQDTTVEDKLTIVFGENNDYDNSKQIDYLRKIEERTKKFGQ